MSEEEKLPRTSYRDLMLWRANGHDVDEVELGRWRREEELIRCAIAYSAHFRGVAVIPKHFLAPLHALAWEAIMQLVEDDPYRGPAQEADDSRLDTAVMLSLMRQKSDELAGGHRGAGWVYAIAQENPVNPTYALQYLVVEVRRHHRIRLWESQGAALQRRVATDQDLASLEFDFAHFGMEMALASQGEGRVDVPLEDFDWDPHSSVSSSLVRTGIKTIDQSAGGGHGRGEMLVWGGGTGHGKSYAARSLLKAQTALGQRALYISCEDAKELMFCRTVADYSEPKVAPRDVRQKTADPEVVARAITAMKVAQAGRIHVIVRKKPTISEVMTAIHTYRYVEGVDLVIVDYLQAIREDETMVNKVQEMASITSKLKRCFTDADVAGVVFSQYSRESYKDGAEPGLNACKYCGDIENESEIMVLMWRTGDGELMVKLPKAKWSATRDVVYAIDVDPTTGCHRGWLPGERREEPENKRSRR